MWTVLLEDFVVHTQQAINLIQERNADDIPGAKDELIARLTNLMIYFPRNDGELLKQIIHQSIEKSFFPRTDNIAIAFDQILNARTPDQDYIIQEVLNGFIASETNLLASNKEGTIIDRLVELFRKSSNFSIIEHQFFNMFGNPNHPRKFLKEGFEKLVKIFGVERDSLTIENDRRTGLEREIIFYRFPVEILAILNGHFIEVNFDTGDVVVLPQFDKMVFVSLFLANMAANRLTIGKYAVNGICNIFALIIILSFMPSLRLDPGNPIFKQSNFDPTKMSVIPKSWMLKNVLAELFPPLVIIIAYLVGGRSGTKKLNSRKCAEKFTNKPCFCSKILINGF